LLPQKFRPVRALSSALAFLALIIQTSLFALGSQLAAGFTGKLLHTTLYVKPQIGEVTRSTARESFSPVLVPPSTTAEPSVFRAPVTALSPENALSSRELKETHPWLPPPSAAPS
jgi:hypothetical protein